MSVFSSGSKWKRAAQQAIMNAEELQEEQQEIDFGRAMLSNIRQQRIAQAQLTTANYSPSFTSTGAIGAASNINSALAGEAGYSYSTSLRQQRISDYQADAERYMKKYAKQQKRRGTAIQVAAIAASALTGGALGVALAGGVAAAGAGAAALTGASIGGTLGSSVANFATGNIEGGINGLISAGSQYAKASSAGIFDEKIDQSLKGVAETSEVFESDYATFLYNANSNQIAQYASAGMSVLDAYMMNAYRRY